MISVIIPTFNAGDNIRGIFEALGKSALKDLEIIVIDSSSTDGTAAEARRPGARVKVIPREQFDHGGTRTLAGKLARGDFLVYLTQDAVPAGPDALRNLLAPFGKDEKIVAVYGRQIPNANANAFAAHLRFFIYPEEGSVKELCDRGRFGIKTPFLSDSFVAYRKSALEAVGWFGQKLICSEDLHAGAKFLLAGHKLAYAASAAVYHSHNYTAIEEARRYFDLGVFHKREAWILKEFGGAGGEGKKYIVSGLRYLARTGQSRLVPAFLMRNALKYLFYNLGLIHEKLPVFAVRRLGMNRIWWEKKGKRVETAQPRPKHAFRHSLLPNRKKIPSYPFSRHRAREKIKI